MKISVWLTEHEIADTMAGAVYEGLNRKELNGSCQANIRTCRGFRPTDIEEADMHISYGILRGAGGVFRACDKANKPWFNIDKGYWKPGHYDGYYRISLRGTQQTIGLDKLKPDYERWDALGLEIFPAKERNGQQLFCPASSHVAQFFPKAYMKVNYPWIERRKGCERPLQDDLDACSNVVTFNSSVGWEALRQGIRVVSDPTHSILGAYQKMLDRGIHGDIESRRKFFAVLAGLQMTLDEIRSGAIWELLQNLLTIS